MTDQEVLIKAVELAEGWKESVFFGCVETPEGYLAVPESSQLSRDALAAQLARQVDAFGKEAHRMADVLIYQITHQRECKDWPPDRTMNTLRAIVGSGVLEVT